MGVRRQHTGCNSAISGLQGDPSVLNNERPMKATLLLLLREDL